MKVDQEKYWIILVLIAVIAFWAGGRDFNTQEMVEIDLIRAEENIHDSEIENNKSDEIIVHIGGEVKNPGVFSFPKGARLIDAISIAGGETTRAGLDRINLARKLNDGEHIIIPSFLASDNSPDFSTNSFSNSADKINLNQAGLEELSSLSGIGEVRAKAIIEYRDNNDGFKEIEEIKNVSGIGTQTYNKIKDDITI
ncbi:MAG: helix-hairpin-helix domain-containing protein [Halarsenatibacteraceae bacterium]